MEKTQIILDKEIAIKRIKNLALKYAKSMSSSECLNCLNVLELLGKCEKTKTVHFFFVDSHKTFIQYHDAVCPDDSIKLIFPFGKIFWDIFDTI